MKVRACPLVKPRGSSRTNVQYAKIRKQADTPRRPGKSIHKHFITPFLLKNPFHFLVPCKRTNVLPFPIVRLLMANHNT